MIIGIYCPFRFTGGIGIRTQCEFFDSCGLNYLTERCPPRRAGKPRELSFCVKEGTCPKNTTDAEIYAKFEKLITDDCPLQEIQQ